jgi:hypothetical protein
MKLICKLIGHDYIKGGDIIEKPYEGNHRVNDNKPHTRYCVLVFCKRCATQLTLNNYFFGHDQNIN